MIPESTDRMYPRTPDEQYASHFCEAIRNDGQTCKAWAWGETRFCYAHRHYALFALVINREWVPSEIMKATAKKRNRS